MALTNMDCLEIGGRRCYLWRSEKPGPAVLWAFEAFTDETLPGMDAAITELLQDHSCQVLAWQVGDWDGELSPWPFEAGDGRSFSGKGNGTLKWLQDCALPWVKERLPASEPVFLTGYSLAGLFSLWAFYESGLFTGCACCSGSLWYPGWEEYADRKQALCPGSLVYLSLGGKEPRTRDPLMATIGDRTKAQEERLKKDPDVRKALFEWNPGGHFANAEKRVCKGIRWLLENSGS